jgi:hypothetical protein
MLVLPIAQSRCPSAASTNWLGTKISLHTYLACNRMRIASTRCVEVTAHRWVLIGVSRPTATWPGQRQARCRRPCRRRTQRPPRICATPPETASGPGDLAESEGASADLGVIWGRLLRVRRSLASTLHAGPLPRTVLWLSRIWCRLSHVQPVCAVLLETVHFVALQSHLLASGQRMIASWQCCQPGLLQTATPKRLSWCQADWPASARLHPPGNKRARAVTAVGDAVLAGGRQQ